MKAGDRVGFAAVRHHSFHAQMPPSPFTLPPENGANAWQGPRWVHHAHHDMIRHGIIEASTQQLPAIRGWMTGATTPAGSRNPHGKNGRAVPPTRATATQPTPNHRGPALTTHSPDMIESMFITWKKCNYGGDRGHAGAHADKTRQKAHCGAGHIGHTPPTHPPPPPDCTPSSWQLVPHQPPPGLFSYHPPQTLRKSGWQGGTSPNNGSSE